MKYFKPKKIIADTIVAEAISYYLAKPADELTKADLENVMRLDLEGTDITDEGLKELAKLQNLKELTLNGTKVTMSGVGELRKELPNCDIRWL